MVIYIAHAELGLEAHCSGEKLHQLSKDVFMIGLGRIVNEHHSVGVLLDRRPAFLVAEVSRNVPQFEVQLSKRRH